MPKLFLDKNFFRTKFLFGTKRNADQNSFQTQIFVNQYFFLEPRYFLNQNFLLTKNFFWTRNCYGPNFFLDQTFFLCPKDKYCMDIGTLPSVELGEVIRPKSGFSLIWNLYTASCCVGRAGWWKSTACTC